MAEAFTAEFAGFVGEVEPRLRRALIARWGGDLGRDAAADALIYAWRHWDKVKGMDNPAGYLYRVGVNSVTPQARIPVVVGLPNSEEPWVEPALEPSLKALSDNQRTAVILHHGFAWTYEEIAKMLDASVSTVRTHIDRGMAKLRVALEVRIDG